MAATPAPLADADTLVQLLALLGRIVTAAGDAPPEPAALHLTRTLVAAAEQRAVAAEYAAAKSNGGHLPEGHDVADHQGTYDLAPPRPALTMLAVAYWRSQRLHAGVQALAIAFTGADSEDLGDEDSVMELVWDLAVPWAAAHLVQARSAGMQRGRRNGTAAGRVRAISLQWSRAPWSRPGGSASRVYWSGQPVGVTR